MKKQKGMTLMEIIVSMAIYAILALLATEIMTSMNTLMRVTDQLNDRLSYEAKYADNLQTSGKTPAPISYTVYYGDDGSRMVGDPSLKGADGIIRIPANEYTVGFDNTADYSKYKDSSTYYVDSIDYRFMVFDKLAMVAEGCPSGPFMVYLRLVPFFTEDADSLTLETKQTLISDAKKMIPDLGTLSITIDADSYYYEDEVNNGNCSGKKYNDIDLSSMSLGADKVIHLVNLGSMLAEDGSDVNKFTKFTMSATKVFFSGDIEREWIDNETNVYMYVKVGSVSNNTESFYNKCIIEFDINGEELKPYRSLGASEDPEPALDYDAILATPSS